MLKVLVASAPGQARPIGPGVAAVAVHIALLAAGAMVGRTAPVPGRLVRVDSLVLFPPTITPSPSGATDANSEAVPGPVPFLVPGTPVPDLPAPDMPESEASLNIGTVLADEIGKVAKQGGEPAPTPAAGSEILLAAEVDEPVAVLQQGRPRYPPRLSALGIPGRVVLEFVVDTAGAVEGTSVRVVQSSLTEFEPAAIEAIVASRFRAARVRGLAVRQLVRQAVSFRAP